VADTKKPMPDAAEPDARTRRRREISGPGAADFLTAPGGLDLPENELSRGTGLAGDDSALTDQPLAPHLDEPDPHSERRIESDRGEPRRRE
jgi:hypothetical protein